MNLIFYKKHRILYSIIVVIIALIIGIPAYNKISDYVKDLRIEQRQSEIVGTWKRVSSGALNDNKARKLSYLTFDDIGCVSFTFYENNDIDVISEGTYNMNLESIYYQRNKDGFKRNGEIIEYTYDKDDYNSKFNYDYEIIKDGNESYLIIKNSPNCSGKYRKIK